MATRTARWRQPSIIPGFGLAFGFTVFYLTIIVLIPIGGLILFTSGLGLGGLIDIALQPRVLAALRTSFVISLLASLFNVFLGLLLAWVIVRYRFPGRRLLDGAIDLPFALPTAVAGIALTALYAPIGPLGSLFSFRISYTPIGIWVALVFVGLPFIVRTVQPVLEEIDKEVEEAAATLGAGRLKTIVRVVFPTILPAAITGFALALARSVGEYGSVIFIAGNIPFVSEIAPLLIRIRLEEYNYQGAAAIATIMLVISFILLVFINLAQAWSRRRLGHV
jgi:sulfate transport system permease protein